MKQISVAVLLLFIFSSIFPSRAQTPVNQSLAEEINRIKAIDNHAHPLRIVRAGERADDEYDALPPEGLEPAPLPLRLNPTNSEFIGAWQAFFNYPFNDMTDAHLAEVRKAKERLLSEHGDNYSAWVLDQLGIETMLANRVAMGRGLTAPRFRWVSFVDALLIPLSNEEAKKVNSDYRVFYTGEERWLKRYMAESNVSARPQTLDAYLSRVVTPTLERMKRDGAVAIKFEAAYLRSLEFDDVPQSEARSIYARNLNAPLVPAPDYKRLQDFLFRYIAREAGRLGLAVHIHTGAGIGGYFSANNGNPMLLESVFNDPKLRKTNFVMLHGGWPFARQVTWLTLKPNAYADFSAQTFITNPRELSTVIRSWLEFAPDKVLYATDAFAMTPEVGWEELGWLSNMTGRTALTMALTDMMNDGEITRERASELARMVLRENAIKLYNLKTQ